MVTLTSDGFNWSWQAEIAIYINRSHILHLCVWKATASVRNKMHMLTETTTILFFSITFLNFN